MDRERTEAGIEAENAHVGRIYDYLLGGGRNFAVDRAQAARILAANPDMDRVCRANRAFLGRVVTWCVEQGIDQFLDLGSGVPTVGNVHEFAPRARVAYVDVESVAVAHAEEIVGDLATVTITRADLRDPDSVLAAPQVAGLLDWTRPIALLSVAVLHFIADPELPALLARYRAVLAPGSVQALSHGSADLDDLEVAARIRGAAEGYRGSATEAHLRSREEIHGLLGYGELVAPGLVDVVHWPEPGTEPITGAYGAVVRLP